MTVILGACTGEMISYEGGSGIYFAMQAGNPYFQSSWPYSPYSDVEFVKIVEDTHTLYIKVMATGEASAVDRTFLIAVDPDSTTATAGVDYEPIAREWTLPAGKLEARVPVVLHRAARMATEEVTIGLQLIENEHFKLTFRHWGPPADLTGGTVYSDFDASRHLLRVNDILVQPAQWLGGFYQYEAGNPEFNTFGAFTPKKFKLLSALTGYVYIDFMTDPPMSFGLQAVLGRLLASHLIAEYRAGRAVTENDGRLMWADGCPWKSYENVPWDGVYVNYWNN
jgi:hypothetical protein